MGKKVSFFWLAFLLACISGFFPHNEASALDAPHNETNNISCGKCHYTTDAFPLSFVTDEDDTANNRICWSCHNDADSAMAETHSSVILGAKYKFGSVAWPDPTGGTGGWSVQCTGCHDPHEQAQFRFYGGAEAGLVGGVTVSASPYNSVRHITTLTVTPSSGRTSDWGLNRWAGCILFFTGPQSTGSMRIQSSETATDGSKILTVEGDASALVNEGFTIVYGKMIKSSIGGQTVRFFGRDKSGDGTDYSFTDTSGATHSGVCETCHVRTACFKADGTGTHAYGVKAGDNCVFCHVAQNAFKPAAATNASGSALVSIAVTPSGSAVLPNQTVQFIATGTYADSTTQNITSSVFWSSSNTATAAINTSGLATSVAAGTTSIMAASGSISGGTTLTVNNIQPTINISMDLHCDPIDQQLTLDQRRTFFRQQLANAAWLMDFVEPYGVKISFLAVGECYEFCTESSEQAACLPLLARLQASGGILGTHSHTEYRRGAHDWPSIPNAYTNPAAADVRTVWDTNKQQTDAAIQLALGLTDPAAIAAVNTASESHAQLTDPNQLMEEYGYTIREGGADQVMANYFSHVPWNPFRPGQTAIAEDLTTQFVTVPQGMVVGHTGPHLGLWQDGTSNRKKAELLQLYANWKERNRTGAAPKVWSFGWGVHTQDLNDGSDSRLAIMDLIPWLRDEFINKADAAGRPLARFASYIDVRNEYLAWEAQHPGVSSFNCAASATDYANYPYFEWANRYMRFARLDSRVTAAGADVFLMKAGDYSAATPTTYPFVLASATGSSASVDLSATLGAGTLRMIKLSDGSITNVPASAVNLNPEPAVLCVAATCDAILALENASTGTSTTPTFVDGGGASGINYDSAKAALEPQLTVFGSNLYSAWHETNGTANQIRVKKYDGTSWTWADGGGANGINFDTSKAASSAQLTVFGSALYASWYESNGTVTRIRVKKFDGSAWTWADGGTANGLNYTQAKNAKNPQITAFGGSLYAIWEEMSPANFSQIRVKKFDGTSWTWADGGGPIGINYSPTLAATAPQLTEFNGSLYAVWQEKNANIDQIRVRRYNGTSWDWIDGGTATGINKNTAYNGDRAQLTVFGNALYATWREGSATAKYQIRLKKYDGSQWTWADGGAATGMNYDTAQDGHESQLTVSGSNMYAIWCEPKAAAPTARQVRVKKYDGSAWTWADGGAATGINYDTSRDGNHQQLTVFNGQLYAAWWEATATASQIRVVKFDSAGTPPASSSALVLVTQLDNKGIYKIDPSTNLIASQITLGTNVGRPAADLTRRIAYLPMGSQLLALKPDTMTYSTLTVTGLGNDGTFAAISPDGRTLAVVNHGADGLRSADDRLDIVTLNPDAWPPTASLNFSVTVGQQPIRSVIDHNGRYAVVSVRDDAKILVIDLVSHQTALQVTLPAGSEPEGMEMHPSENVVYVTLHGTNRIEILDLRASPLDIGSVAISSNKPGNNPQPSGGHFTPDGSRFYISAQITNEVLLFNSATVSSPVQDTGVSLATGPQPHDIAFMPDGRAYVANTNNGQQLGSISVMQNYSATPSMSGVILNNSIINPLYIGYFPAVP